jgi:hypothetical protein
MQDPLFTYRAYPLNPDLSDGDKRKLDRVYYPRTGRMLIDDYRAMIFRDARIQHFSPRMFRDLDYAFREAGMASVTAHGPSWEHAWSISTLYELSPVDDFVIRFYNPWRVSFRREREPVFLPFAELGMEKVVGDAYGTMEAKPGATIWADMQPQNVPWLVSWRASGGSGGVQWVFADKFDQQWWGIAFGAREANPYGLDLCTNLLLYSIGEPLIGDIHARRESRHLFTVFQGQKLLVLSMLEWAERFGASVLPLAKMLTELEEGADIAVDSYLEQDYDAAIGFMDSVNAQVVEISAEAVRLKDEAMLWVYISEWLTVTSVALLAGFVIWNLMVKRALYAETGRTKLMPL